MKHRWPGVVLPLVLACAAAWSLVPLAMWWDDVDASRFSGVWEYWLSWYSLAAVLLAVAALVLTRGRIATQCLTLWRGAVAAAPARFVGTMAALLALLAVLMCVLVFSGNPRNVDGFAQLFQARIFLSGRLWAPPPPEIASFATLQMIVGPARWFSQYPPGQSLVLAAGLALGAWWLLNPLLAAVLVWATWRAGRWCVGESAARLALVLLCVSPFVVAMAGSEMSHLAAATLGMSAAALATMAAGRRPVAAALAAGAALGAMLAFRPLDAVAAALPAGVILLVALPRSRRVTGALAAALGGIAATLPTFAFNRATTGSWRTFGYTYLWGPEHSLGFHDVPFGVPLTLTRAIARSGFDLHQLNAWLFDAPFPVMLLIAAGWLAGRRALGARDAVPVLGAGALVAALFAYWHRDVFYGPRFLFSAVPWVVLVTARAVVMLRGAGRTVLPGVSLGFGAACAVATAFLIGVLFTAPERIAAFRAATPLFDLHPDRDAERAGISHAVVVIPDGWGTRLIVRMWAAGVPVRRSTRLYAAIDACTIEHALDAAERDPAVQRGLVATLDSLAALRRPGVREGLTDDPNLRVPAGAALEPACREEVDADRTGFLAFAPFLYLNSARLDGDIVWARDLGPRNRPLFGRYAGRSFYRYAPPAPGVPPAFTPITAP